MIRLAGLIFAILVASVACDTLGTPPAAPAGEPAPDVEATVRAVIGSVQSTPQSTAQPGEEVDLQATIIASVQATVEALRSATPIPSPTPTVAPAAQAAPAQATSSNTSPTPAVTAVTAPTLQPTATSVPTPTPTPEPTVSPTPAPAPTLAANCGTVADGTPVTALIDGQAVASAAMQNGAYNIFIDQGDSGQFSGKTVTFKIGTLDANESSNWVQGGVSELDLTASPADASSGQPEPTTGPDTATSVQPREGGLLAQPVPPHFFVGKATIVC